MPLRAGEALLGYAPVDVPDDEEDFADAQPTEENPRQRGPAGREPTLAELGAFYFSRWPENVAGEIP